jgi:2-haloacid dehalogenase
MRYTAYVFDAYGTLFDVHSAVRRHAEAIGPDGPLLSEIWRTKQLEYSWVRTLMGGYADFSALTGQALDFAFAKVPSADPSLKASLLEAYWRLDCYPEVPGVLRELKASGARLAILSNGSPAMLEAAVKSAALGALFDDVFSVDAVKRFKTDPATYRMVTDSWRIEPGAVSFQSSNRWDIAGASRFGFRTVWINRTNQPDEYPDFAPSRVLSSLEGLLAEG